MLSPAALLLSASPPPKRNLALWLLIALFALAFFIKGGLSEPRHHGVLRVVAEDGVRFSIVQYAQRNHVACTRQASAMARALEEACAVCKVVEASCRGELSARERDFLGEVPLPLPSARTRQGVIVYEAGDPAKNLASCQLATQQGEVVSALAGLSCFDAGAARPFPPEQAQRIGLARTRLGVFTALMVALSVGLGALVWVAHRARRTARVSPWTTKLTLAGTDALVMLAAYAVLGFPLLDDPMGLGQFDSGNLITHGVLVLVALGWFWIVLEHYARRRPFWDELREIFRTLTMQLLLAGATLFYAALDVGRGMTLITWASLFVLLPLGRVAARRLLDAAGLWREPAVIIGSGENAREALRAIQSEHGMGYEVQAFLHPGSVAPTVGQIDVGPRSYPVLHTPDIEHSLAELRGPHVIVALEQDAGDTPQLVQQLTRARQKIHVIPSLRGLPLYGTQLAHFFSHEVLFLTVRNNLSRRSHKIVKRLFDVIAAALLLGMLAPLFAVLSMLIRRSGGSAFYGHTRIGRFGRPFKCLKFRSMRPDADRVLQSLLESDPVARAEWERDFKLRCDPRITPVGHFLRKTSLDELPQLINVLRGEMSLVGPRPVVSAELPRYGDQVDLYLQARPGVTGLWQVSGRNDTGYAERVALDAWYVQNWSLWYDIAILFKTIGVVLRRDGAY